MTTTRSMQVYVGTYAKYNEGDLFGSWLDLSDYSDKEEFYEACAELHDDEDDPEFMFQDYEGIPEQFIGESWISEMVWDLLDSDIDDDALIAYLDHFGTNDRDDFSDIESAFDERFQGEWDSEEDFGENLFDELYAHDVPDNIKWYIDYEKFSRDLFMGDYVYVNGYVFSCY